MTTQTRVLSAIETMVEAFHRGDIDGILRAYEPAAVVVGEPGAPAQGEGPLREMFAGFVAAQARFTFDGHEVLVAGDVALHLAPWKMSGVAPDGSQISGAGLSIAVLRRQGDGSWLMVIDNPYGDHLLQSVAHREQQPGAPR
jgi:uncharacterized protein (TIGR02246 family)